MNPNAIAKACLATATALQQLAAALEAELPAAPPPPASVAEPECGCSLYTRCAAHNTDKRCRCNGPDFPSSACLHPEHRTAAALRPHADPARLD